MNDDDAFRERLAAPTPEQIGQLYDATADEWTALRISQKALVHNMGAKAQYDAAVRPLELVYQASFAMSDSSDVLWFAQQTYERELERLHGPESAERPVNELRTQAQALKRVYDEAIEARGG